MKKLMTLLGIMFIGANISVASLTDINTSDINILKSQGYSEAALRMIDTAKSHHQYAENNKYQKYYTEKQPKNIFGKAYTTMKVYFDPMQEDNAFAEHQVNFSNTWNSDETNYSLRTEGREIEDL